MKNKTNWLWIAMIPAALVVPGAAEADLPCPLCPAAPLIAIEASDVVTRVLSTLLQKGVAVLLLGSTALVSLPWLIAGVASAAFHVPRRLRAWW